ncbi:hypothetical protein DYB32_001505 [Aphanomyces invadans]|uniref:BZIP domain-containing protein n=1 Tax=Aphanomyces invadans TaxID=157072 RepID=A0A418B656_9STRA|nr:hypothetical protein DYB32_001505 [Aphanomyces invadans]
MTSTQGLQDSDLANYFLENAGGSTKGPYEDVSLHQISTSLGLAMPKAAPIDFSFNPMPGSSTPKSDVPAMTLERNRISARDSRRRKKQYLELLEEKVAQLTEDIDITRMEHLDTADKTITAVKAQMITSLYEKLAPLPPNAPLPADVEDELGQVAQLLKDRYGPNSEVRLT